MLKNYHLVYIGLELAIACLAIAGNILVCWAVCLNSNLQSITNLFVVSLAAADIAVGLLAIPFAITISTGFCADFHGCLFIACFVLVLTQSSIFSLLAIAVDRYIAIKNPLRYNSLVTSQRAKGIIAFCWLLSVGIGLTPMLGWNKGWNSTTASTSSCPEGLTECLFEGVVTLDYMIYFNFFGCVLLPLAVMLVVYAHIFMAARRQLRLMSLKKVAPAPSRAEKESSSFRSTLHKELPTSTHLGDEHRHHPVPRQLRRQPLHLRLSHPRVPTDVSENSPPAHSRPEGQPLPLGRERRWPRHEEQQHQADVLAHQ